MHFSTLLLLSIYFMKLLIFLKNSCIQSIAFNQFLTKKIAEKSV
jgi:hypothetical protein